MARERSQFVLLVMVGTLVGVSLVGGLALVLRSTGRAEFVGSALEPPFSASDFTLTDQNGERFQLSDARGQVVVLTFLYTSCEDVCPFIGVKLRRAMEILGNRVGEVEIVVVTIDPERDTIERTAEYSRTLGMLDSWHFLTGDLTELQAVWQAFYVSPGRSAEPHAEHPEELLEEYGLLEGLTDQDIQSARQAVERYGGGYEVGHSTPIWIVDKSGEVSLLHGQGFLPSAIVQDIQILLDRNP